MSSNQIWESILTLLNRTLSVKTLLTNPQSELQELKSGGVGIGFLLILVTDYQTPRKIIFHNAKNTCEAFNWLRILGGQVKNFMFSETNLIQHPLFLPLDCLHRLRRCQQEAVNHSFLPIQINTRALEMSIHAEVVEVRKCCCRCSLSFSVWM